MAHDQCLRLSVFPYHVLKSRTVSVTILILGITVIVPFTVGDTAQINRKPGNPRFQGGVGMHAIVTTRIFSAE
jgi:hypothetical protein